MEHEFLTDEEMAEIQQRYAEGFSMDTLAQMYDMTVADVAWVVQEGAGKPRLSEVKE